MVRELDKTIQNGVTKDADWLINAMAKSVKYNEQIAFYNVRLFLISQMKRESWKGVPNSFSKQFFIWNSYLEWWLKLQVSLT